MGLDPGAIQAVSAASGGAWSIGYKAWGAILAERLSAAGALVATIDYRNFPQGNALDMLQDVNTGISWVCRQTVPQQ
ncbi:carboxylic ester hydrolase [Haematococcus lacustris]|uniref:Carboxylic ester hydrolase n=1 Tax=Haematococcus lacustris TaxID=44745 RepID=A0A699YF74_HAELA|nr:carboxylic ester hydrolase [Haematococcus lacustris]